MHLHINTSMYSYVFSAIVRLLTFWIQVSEFYHKTTKKPFNNQMFGTCMIITMSELKGCGADPSPPTSF